MELQEKHVSNTTCCTQNAVIFTLEIDFNTLLQKESFVRPINMGILRNTIMQVSLSYSSPSSSDGLSEHFFHSTFFEIWWPVSVTFVAKVHMMCATYRAFKSTYLWEMYLTGTLSKLDTEHKWTLSLEQSTQSDNCVQKRYGTFSCSSVLWVFCKMNTSKKGEKD